MRLWHEALIPYLPRQQLLGLHREVCALRGLGWGRKHSTVDYVFQHPRFWLFAYHLKVMDEMHRRGYNVAPEWYDYMGKRLGHMKESERITEVVFGNGLFEQLKSRKYIYPEHNEAYLQECLENLAGKGVNIHMGKRKER